MDKGRKNLALLRRAPFILYPLSLTLYPFLHFAFFKERMRESLPSLSVFHPARHRPER